MKKSTIALLALMVMVTGACANKLEMQPGQAVGAYKIIAIDLEKNPESNVTDEEFAYIRQQVITKLVPELSRRGYGQQARLKINLTSTNIDPTAVYTIVVAGGSYIAADVTVYDTTGTMKIAEQSIYSSANTASAGVLGAVLNNTLIDHKEDITTAFAEDVIELLYPESH